MLSLDRLPNWRIELKEISPGVFKVTGMHSLGPQIKLIGTDERKLISEIQSSAKLMELLLRAVPNWRIELNEAAPGAYKVSGMHLLGPRIELTGTDQEKLISEFQSSAKLMELEIEKKSSQPLP